MGKYKLKCFRCGRPFKNRSEVWRNRSGEPLCMDCMYEYIDMDWENADQVIETVGEDFNHDYRRYMNCIEDYTCPKCGATNAVLKGENFYSCWDCEWNVDDYDEHGQKRLD
jgi:DNA-directed RNA polymerase subunit RPC12/RpoP